MKNPRFKLTLLMALIFVGGIIAQQKEGRPPVRVPKVPAGVNYQVKHYRQSDFSRASEMSIAYKEDGVQNKPVVVFIHGGGWTKGDNDQVSWQVMQVAQRGFVGVGISYRLLQEAPFPACIEDVKQAIRYLKSLQDELPIDVDRIGVWGYSAGAHLALMIALSPDQKFKTEAYSEYTSEIKSVMAVSAPTDFETHAKEKNNLKKFGNYKQDGGQFLKELSPISYIHEQQIPVIMLHGKEDTLVKPYHYLNFAEKCKSEGISNFKLYEIEDGGHMLYFKQKETVKPIFQQFLKSI